jgi:hypothetical protein
MDYFLILWIASSVATLLPRNDTALAMDCFLLRKFAMTKVIYKRLLCIKAVSKTIAPRNDGKNTKIEWIMALLAL